MTNEVGMVTALTRRRGRRCGNNGSAASSSHRPWPATARCTCVSETGEMFVLRAGAEAEVIATNDLGERFLASPAISGGRIFLRSDRTLFAVGR